MSNQCRVRGRHLAFLLGLAGVAVQFASSSGFADPQSGIVAADDKQLEARWIDLEKGEVEASRALLDLYDHAQDAVPFLNDKLKPLKISSGQVKALLLKLNSANENLWKTAFAELEYFDPRLAIELPELMERVKDSPGRQRMVEVLSERDAGSLEGKEIEIRPVGEGFNFFCAVKARGGPSPRSRRSIPIATVHSKGSGLVPSEQSCCLNRSELPKPCRF